MAALKDMLGKKTGMENGSSYQPGVVREIARRLSELEEQNDQNAMVMDEIRKMQKTVLQRLDSMKAGQDGMGQQTSAGEEDREEIQELQREVRGLTLKLQSGVQNLDAQLQSLDVRLKDVMDQVSKDSPEEGAFVDQDDLLDKLDTVRLSLEDTIHKENIKCFRNVQGALEEQGDGKAYDLNALRKYLRVIIWFQLVTIVLLVLQSLGLL